MTTKIISFPTALPDELLFSDVTRYHNMSGNASQQMTLLELFGAKTLIPGSSLPSHLDRLFSALPAGSFSTISDLIEKTTLLPYYRPFLPPDRVADIVARMRGTDGRGIKVKIGIVASSVRESTLLRLCKECTRADVADHGTPYWHRSHQLPGVTVCFVHGSRLLEGSPACRNVVRGRHELYLPRVKCETGRPVAGHWTSSDEVDDGKITPGQEQRFAVLSRKLLVSNAQPFPEADLRAAYSDRLVAKGLVRRSGRLDYRVAAAEMVKQYGEDMLQRLGCTFGHSNWLFALMNRNGRVSHPVKHLLVIGLLYETVDDFLSEVSNRRRRFGQPVTPLLTDTEWQRQLPTMILEQHLSLRAIGKRLSKSVTTVRIECQRRGLPVARRRSKHWDGVDDAITTDLRSTASISEIAGKNSVSGSHVRRVLRANSALQHYRQCVLFEAERAMRRSLMEGCLLQHPDLRRVDIKRMIYPHYTWLHRHDRTWLEQQLPLNQQSGAPRNVDWQERDKMYCEDVRRVGQEILARRGSPRRVTVSLVGRKLGILSNLEKHLQFLPRTAAVISKIAETVDQYQCRRAALAVERLRNGGQRVVPWRIIRLAGLKKRIAPLVRETIQRLCADCEYDEK